MFIWQEKIMLEYLQMANWLQEGIKGIYANEYDRKIKAGSSLCLWG